jgi:hypothetical protein
MNGILSDTARDFIAIIGLVLTLLQLALQLKIKPIRLTIKESDMKLAEAV